MANLRANKIVVIGSTDACTTFDGPISLNTQGYMYFSTGNTTDRGRGRGIIGGGHDGSSLLKTIQYLEIQSQGNTIDFGDLTFGRRNGMGGLSDSHGGLGGF